MESGALCPTNHMPKLRWTATHDAIELSVIDHRVYDYFIGELNAKSINKYSVSNLDIASLSKELSNYFGTVRLLFQEKLRIDAFDFDFDPSQQQHLNYLHQQWVKLHQRYPSITRLVDQHCPGAMYQINKLIHRIEQSYQDIEIVTEQPTWCMPNTFGADVLQHGWSNLSISYNNLGRSSFDKWMVGDTTLDTDLNNFEEFYTTLRVKVMPVTTALLPESYQNWCRQHQIPCVGSQMPLANFDNVEQNMLKYRQMFYKNSMIENNFIILE